MYTMFFQLQEKNHSVLSKNVYHSLDGAAMGSPLGSTQPNALVCQFKIMVVDGGPAKFEPIEYNS